jgi:hypothetical protein
MYLPAEFHAIVPVLVVDVGMPAGATHVYQDFPSGFGVIKLNVPDIVEFIGALDILYPPDIVLTIVVPLGIPIAEIIVPLVIVSVLARRVPVTDPVIVLIG